MCIRDRLKKALYGLKDAPRHWYLTIDSYLGEIGFLPLKSDPCVYVYVSKNSKQPTTNIAEGLNHVAAILALYVDDVILIGGDDAVLSMLKKKSTARFKMKDLGHASLVLGMEKSRAISMPSTRDASPKSFILKRAVTFFLSMHSTASSPLIRITSSTYKAKIAAMLLSPSAMFVVGSDIYIHARV